MSFKNKTPNYDLPQYIATDKPTYLVDANGAYLAIDTAMKTNETAAATAQSTADTNTAAISELNTQINGDEGIAADLAVVKTLAATTAGNVNTINSLIGNGEPTTTDKTLIGAINELNAGKVAKGNILKYLGDHVVYVEANGTETYGDLIERMTETFNNYLSTKGNTYRYKFISVYASSIDIYPISFNTHEILTKNANLTGRFCNVSLINTGDILVSQIVFDTTPRLGRNLAGTYTDYINQTAAGQLRVYIEEFEVV